MIKADIYRNLNVPKDQDEKWSVLDRTTRRVKDIISSALVKNVRFVVQPAGRARVIKEGRKNVHAFVRGDLLVKNVGNSSAVDGLTKVSYNPYEADHFIREDTNEAIYEADTVWVTPVGVYILNN